MLHRQLLLCAVALLVGCSKTAAPPVTAAPVAGIYRFGHPPMNGTPGLDMGSMYFGEGRIVLWVNGGVGKSETSSTATGTTCNGTIIPTDGPSLKSSYSVTAAGSGSVVIADKTFDLANGNLFLVDPSITGLRTMQLKRDFDDVQFTVGDDTGKDIHRLLRGDTDVCAFFDPNHEAP